MTDLESNAAGDPIAAPTMTYGLNDMGLPQPQPPVAPPRRPKLVPNTEDVQALFINPALAERFDRQWGQGTAKNLLDKYRILRSTSADQPVIDAVPVDGEAAQANEASEAAADRLRRSVRRGQSAEHASAEQALPDMLPSERDPSLPQQQEIGLYERHRLNRRDSFYRGTLAGAGYLAAMKQAADSVDEPGLTPAVRRARDSVRRQYLAIVADLARYDQMDPFGTELEAVAGFTGQFTGGLPTPESLAGAGIKSTYAIARFAWAAAQQGLIALGTDPFIQKASIHSGVQEDYDAWRTAMRAALAVTIGPLGAVFGPRGPTTSGGASAGRKGVPGGDGPVSSETPAAPSNAPSGAAEAPAAPANAAPGAAGSPGPGQAHPPFGQTKRPFRVEPQAEREIESLVVARAPQDQILAHPSFQAAVKELRNQPKLKDLPGYGTAEFQSGRRFLFDGEEIIGYDAITPRLRMAAEAFSTEGPVEKGRMATIVLGLPAAGKSTISKRLARTQRAAILDSDEAKEVIPEYHGGIGAAAVHDESVELIFGRSRVADQLFNEGANVVIPRVGTNPAEILHQINSLVELGYTVNVVHMTVDPDEAFRRMVNRFLKTTRLIDPDYFTSVGTKPREAYIALQREGSIHQAVDIDANGPPGKLSVLEGSNTDLAAVILGRHQREGE